MPDFTSLLDAAAHGDEKSTEALLPLVYEELRKIARVRMASESAAHTLQPTALVHEAWVSLADNPNQTWESRACFLSAAATAMRHILIDHARKKTARKRGGDQKRISIDETEQAAPEKDETILMVEDALQKLEQIRPDWARIVVMKFYGGLTNREVAEVLDISESSIERYWAGARALLYKQLISET